MDAAGVAQSRRALEAAGVKLKEHPVVVASKAEAREAFSRMKHDPEVNSVGPFSGRRMVSYCKAAALRSYLNMSITRALKKEGGAGLRSG